MAVVRSPRAAVSGSFENQRDDRRTAERDATLITICNYDKYQSARRANDPPTDAASDALATQRRTREQEDTSSSSLRSEEDCFVTREADQKSAEEVDAPAEPIAVARQQGFGPDAFTAFWSAYPHKVGKRDALKAFETVARSGGVTCGELMAGLARYVATKPAERPWCNPGTWLRQGRWDDEPDHLAAPTGRSSRRRPHRSPHDALADAVARDLAGHPDSRFYQPPDRRGPRGADAVIAGMAMVAAKRLAQWAPDGKEAGNFSGYSCALHGEKSWTRCCTGVVRTLESKKAASRRSC